MLKNYNYAVTIILYPFLITLSYLKLSHYLKSELYTYLILALLIIFIPSFIMSLYSAAEAILTSKKKWRIILLILLSIFYLPIFYTKNIVKEEKYLGILLFIISIPLTYITFEACYKEVDKLFQRAYKVYVVIDENYIHYSSNKLFSINVDKTFRCNEDDMGEYVIACDRLEDDSFIGIYSYDITNEDEYDINDKFEFHLGQVLEYIEESGNTYEVYNDDAIVRIEYGENVVLMTQSNYLLTDSRYSLIIMKEMPKEYLSVEEYQKMIDSISFFNYNERVSS